jgi:hypothetical protein
VNSMAVGSPKKRGFFLHPAFLMTMLLAGCIHLVSYYDSQSYKNLTDLKASASILFDDLSQDPAGKGEKAELDSLRLDLEKAYEYEKGKEKNGETITQISTVRKIYDGMLQLLKKKEKLSDDYIAEKKTQMMDAFDIAIKTETEKISKE